MIWTLKKCNKKTGSPCLFTRQQALKLGYFYWSRVKNSNPLLTELSQFVTWNTQNFILNKTSFIQISSIASFNSFLIAWLRGYCTFSDSYVVRLKSWPWPKYTKYETIFQKNHVLLSNFFASSNMFFIRLFLANTWEKIGGHRACFLTNCCERWTWFLRSQSGWIICSAGTGARYKLDIKLVFGCFYLFDIANTEIQTWKEYNKYQGMR